MISNRYQTCDCDPLDNCKHKKKKPFRLPPLTKEALDRINEVGRIVNEEMKKKMANYDAPKDQKQLDSAVRPWGRWEVIDHDQGYKVKRLDILPGEAISMQFHHHRSEHWTIVQGEGKVIVDGNIFKIQKGESFHVPRLSIHKITNTHLTETLIAIEVQMGDICSEDDIVRC